MRALHNYSPISRHFTLFFYALKKGMVKKTKNKTNKHQIQRPEPTTYAIEFDLLKKNYTVSHMWLVSL